MWWLISNKNILKPWTKNAPVKILYMKRKMVNNIEHDMKPYQVNTDIVNFTSVYTTNIIRKRFPHGQDVGWPAWMWHWYIVFNKTNLLKWCNTTNVQSNSELNVCEIFSSSNVQIPIKKEVVWFENSYTEASYIYTGWTYIYEIIPRYIQLLHN